MFCIHKWKILGYDEYMDVTLGCKMPVTKYHLQCCKCGKLKHKQLQGHVKNG